MIKIQNIFNRTSLCLSSTLLTIIPFSINGTTLVSANTVNAEHLGLSTKNKNNNEVLQKIINSSSNVHQTIYISEGTYYFGNGDILLHSNITFRFAKKAIFKIPSGHMLTFSYPSPSNGYNGGIQNVHWYNATFIGENHGKQSSITQSLSHAKNISFKNCTFYNTQNPYGHDFDIDGSHNISISNSIFTGFNPAPKNIFKEAIQIDYSNRTAMTYIVPSDKYDNLPTYNVYVQNNQFLPIKTTKGIKSFAPNPIGEHTFYINKPQRFVHNIIFNNNTVIDSIPRSSINQATINFDGVDHLTISNNHFINTQSRNTANYIRIYNPLNKYRISEIKIYNNTFIRINPLDQFIQLKTNTFQSGINKIFIENNHVLLTFKKVKFLAANFKISYKINETSFAVHTNINYKKYPRNRK